MPIEPGGIVGGGFIGIEVAEAMRQSGEDRYVWTTGSWLLYEYLEQADSEQRKRMEEERKSLEALDKKNAPQGRGRGSAPDNDINKIPDDRD